MTTRRTASRSCAALAFLVSAGMLPAQVRIGEATYRRLDTREATRAAVLAQLTGVQGEWGAWYVLAPLDHPGGALDVATPREPERELSRLRAGGPGPDLAALYAGQGGEGVPWREVREQPDIGGAGGMRPLDLRAGIPPGTGTNAVAYVYRRVDNPGPAPVDVPVDVGSDDGVRLWMNGAVVLDAPVERPHNASDHRLALRLQPGVNHVLAKVTQGRGQWAFSLRPAVALDPVAESALDWQLDDDFPTDESRFYRIATVPIPAGVELEVGGLAVLPPPDGRPIATTRRGEVWIVNDAYGTPPTGARLVRFASGLHEPLGAAVRPSQESPRGWSLWTAQRGELTELVDTTGDGAADVFRTVCDAWQLSGNYHEYAFGPEFDARGRAYINLNLAHTGGETVMEAAVPTRGWAVRVLPDGTMEKVADGLRSPDGLGLGPDGTMFYTDNQGDYVATNRLAPLDDGSFQGHQSSLRHRDGFGPDWRARAVPVPPVTPAAVWFPYEKLGQSATDILLDDTAGAFGPFAGHLFVGEQTQAMVTRVALERVDGVYQGACFPFRHGFASGVHRLAWAPDGSLLVGMTDRGWGSIGPKRAGLQRVIWTGDVPFEMHSIRAKPDGFEIVFTRGVADDALDPALYAVSSYTYLYRPEYGSPEVDTRTLTVRAASRTGPRAVRLVVEPLRAGGLGYVHEIRLGDLRAAPEAPGGTREPLLHDVAYYTLQKIPSR